MGVEPRGGTSDDLPSIDSRKIVRTASLSVTADDVPATVSEIGRIARAAGGYVSESSLVAGGEGADSAWLTLRVPATAFDDVLDQVRAVSKDTPDESSKADEVTEEYTDLQSRLTSLQSALARYRELFARAESIGDVLTIQERIDGVQQEIDRLQGRLNVLDDLTDLGTITVAVSLPAAAPGGQNWAVEALEASWEASRDFMVVLGTVAIASAVLAAWLVPLGLLGLVGWRLFGKRVASVARRLYEL